MSNDKEMTAIVNLANEIDRVRKNLEIKEDAVKSTKEQLRRLEEEDLPNMMNEIGLSRFETQDGQLKINLQNFYRGHISKEKQPEAFAWMRKEGHGDLIKNEVKTTFGKGEDASAMNIKKYLNEKGISFTDKESVHPQSLNAFIREQTEKGKALPHDLLGVHIGQIAKIKRGE